MAQVIMSGKIVNGTSMATSFTSEPVDISNASVVGVHLVSASDTRAGNAYIEGSIDGVNYATIATVAVTTATALNHLEDIVDTGAKYLQIRYAATSGAGNLYAYVTKK